MTLKFYRKEGGLTMENDRRNEKRRDDEERAESTNTTTSVSRRAVLKGAIGLGVMTTVGTAGFHLAAGDAEGALRKPPKKWNREADLIVLGAGAGGLFAAIEGRNAGSEVLLLEKTSAIGGSTAICGGLTSFAGTDEQKAMGIKDSNELFYEDFIKAGEGLCMEDLVRVLIDNQLDAYRLLKEYGVTFKKEVVMASGMSVPRCHQWDRPQLINALRNVAQKKGAKILLDTGGKRLVTDCDKVLGVEVESKGKTAFFKARKSVILCTGGFARNAPMLVDYVLGLRGAVGVSGAGCTGDGHRMAQSLGSNLVQMGTIRGVFIGAGPDWNLSLVIYYVGAVIVNKEGKRFVNESLSYKIIPDYVSKQADQVGYVIFDSAIAEKSKGLAALYNVNVVKDVVVVADTIEDLASKLGLPPKTLKETIQNYNRYVETGQDPECGRTTMVEGQGKPVKLEKPPWYGLPQKTTVPTTYGGIQVNPSLRVVDVFGDPIPRLYAAGEIIGGVHGAKSSSGTATLKAFTYGRLAGRNAAKEKPWK